MARPVRHRFQNLASLRVCERRSISRYTDFSQ